MEKMNSLQEHIHYKFTQVKLLINALTHSSYANEVKSGSSNERLEFLGDAVLDLHVSWRLFHQFTEANEGQLTRLRARLVNENTLADCARNIGLDTHILLGKGEESQGGRQRDALLADGIEALIGAIYLDGGEKAAADFIDRILTEIWPRQADLPLRKDYKSRLQEMTQKLFQERPVYTLVQSSGPEHAKNYLVQVTINDQLQEQASASSVKKAEQHAARKALALLTESNSE